jgi:hypothetical protein
VARCDSGGQRTRVVLHSLPLHVDCPPGVYGSIFGITNDDDAAVLLDALLDNRPDT